ncbi:Hypothetical protein, putative [Bodo saltans]|uniref:Uncharacterized protein n=1 Tax=Bodo saltans TaxID=75058 RepID=A0A0S4IL23_BODSA|nr:Hypothetical protein, putative [Bodo saltans]|eukprot:CUE64932.1 Hypothetical protein, putative [Bodo saltans]
MVCQRMGTKKTKQLQLLKSLQLEILLLQMNRFYQSNVSTTSAYSPISISASQNQLSLLCRRTEQLRSRREQLTSTLAYLRPAGSVMPQHLIGANTMNYSYQTASDDSLLSLWRTVHRISEMDVGSSSPPPVTTSSSPYNAALHDLVAELQELTSIVRFTSSSGLFDHHHHPSQSPQTAQQTQCSHEEGRGAGYTPQSLSSSQRSIFKTTSTSQQLAVDLPNYCGISSQNQKH